MITMTIRCGGEVTLPGDRPRLKTMETASPSVDITANVPSMA